MQTISRRKVLTAAIGGGLGMIGWWRFGAAASAFAADASSAATANPSGLIVRNTRGLGTDVSVSVIHADTKRAEAAIAAGFEELDRIEQVLSIYRPTSQLCRLNRDGRLADADERLLAVLKMAQATARQSDGAFDVSVQPLWDLHARAAKALRTPTEEEVSTAKSFVDYRQIEIDGSTVRLKRAGMAVTFNGIAQGYATDRVSEVLRRRGIEHALIDVGELGAIGDKSPAEHWKVGIQHPREPDAYVALAELSGRCLATSGDYSTAFDDTKRDHHIFDPATGHSPKELSSVTIAAPTAMQADALSTAVFVLGLEKGATLIDSLEKVDALFVTKDGTVKKTKHFPTPA